jgi:hypothetical protein
MHHQCLTPVVQLRVIYWLFKGILCAGGAPLRPRIISSDMIRMCPGDARALPVKG